MVRGLRQYLYDAHARAYLDCVNNVAVIGHSHPRVTAAATRQLRLLNTNSRFLYESMTRFAERLAALLPAPLERVFLVSTGSEANDLALRLARAATRRADVICIRDAYHGWTTATYEVSTSSVDNPLGAQSQPELRAPGRSRPTPTAARSAPTTPMRAPRYAESVRDAIAALAERGPRARGVHLRGAVRQRRRHRPARRLPGGRVRARARRGRPLHRGRGAGRLRAPGRAFLGLRAAGRGARHRHDREGDRERPSGRGRDHDGARSPMRSRARAGSSRRSAAVRSRARSASRCST